MRRKQWIIGLMGAAAILSSCYDYAADELATEATTPVSVSLLVSVTPPPSTTRMANDIVQTAPSLFRGIEPSGVWFIPFTIPSDASAVIASDPVKRNVLAGTDYDTGRTIAPYYYWTDGCQFMQSVNAFLVYAKARRADGGNAVNGALDFDHDMAYSAASLQFSPVQIQPTLEVPQGAQAVADYLTRIANSSANGVSWKNIHHAVLDTLYNYFTNHNRSTDPQPMAGSTANALAHVKVLRKALTEADFTNASGADAVKTDILNNIRSQLSITSAGDTLLMTADLSDKVDYPASSGLPDGAAVLRWNADDEQFEPQIQTTATDNINNITRYVYPAELWYRANSRIRVAHEVDPGRHDPADSTWAQVLAANYDMTQYTAISNSVKAVAISEPLDYAVGRLCLKLKDTAATLKDADDNDITIDEGAFPLTGLVVGCQRPVDFEFKPLPHDDIDAYQRFVYDSQLSTTAGSPRLCMKSGTGESAEVNTLLLQTDETDTKVPLVLEFLNKSGKTFKGEGGLIRPDTKFYLVGEINLADKQPAGATGDYARRVFTQDYTTEVTVEVTSLAKAYNILPDLLSARLAVGVQLVTKWVQSSTSYVILQ